MEGPLGARSFLIANGEFLAAHERRIRSWRRRYQRRGRECDRLTPRKWSDHSRSSFNVPNGCQRWTYSRDFDLEIYKRVSERGKRRRNSPGPASLRGLHGCAYCRDGRRSGGEGRMERREVTADRGILGGEAGARRSLTRGVCRLLNSRRNRCARKCGWEHVPVHPCSLEPGAWIRDEDNRRGSTTRKFKGGV
jgi:hypothetical protein